MKNKKIILGCLLLMHCSILCPSQAIYASAHEVSATTSAVTTDNAATGAATIATGAAVSEKNSVTLKSKNQVKSKDSDNKSSLDTETKENTEANADFDNNDYDTPEENASSSSIQLRTSSSDNYYLNKKSGKILLNHSLNLTVFGVSDDDTVSFSSSNSDIISLKKSKYNKCNCKGIAVGTATVTVKVKQNFLFLSKTVKTMKCVIEVTPYAASIRIQNPAITIKEGNKKSILVTLKPIITCETPSFITSNPEVATVSKKGVVTAHSEGIAIITAKIDNGDFATCIVTVK